MNEFLPILLVLVVGGSLAALQASRFDKQASPWILASFGAHAVTSFIQVWFTRAMYGSGDMVGYTGAGESLATTMRLDPGEYVPEVLRLLFHQEAQLPIDIIGAGSSTGSMAALAGLLTFITGGSLYTLSLCVSIGSHFGLVALYRAFREVFPAVSTKRLLFAALFVPSEVFWSSGLIKEGVAVFGLGYVVWGLQRLLRGINVGAIAWLALGAIVVGLFKPYILVALTAGAVGYVAVNSSKGRDILSRPGSIVLGAFLGVIGSAIILRLFPNYSPDAIAEQAAYLQEMGQVKPGGSTYSMGDATRTSFAGQIAFAPVALVTSLFRPFVFEARSPQVFVNAIETSCIFYLSMRILFRRKLSETWEIVTRQPMLVFALIFVALFGVGVGLTTTNMGTLSRYRMPLVPFLWTFVFVMSSPVTQSTVARVVSRRPARSPVHRGAMARAAPTAVLPRVD
jgi:hypothetical protein